MAMQHVTLAAIGDLGMFEQEGIYIPTLVFGCIVILVLIRTIGSVLRSNSREKTRREIAAYIAEGSMSPEQGERLMKAGKD
jgi:hypothetical protein